jgi:hypothetical protein
LKYRNFAFQVAGTTNNKIACTGQDVPPWQTT